MIKKLFPGAVMSLVLLQGAGAQTLRHNISFCAKANIGVPVVSDIMRDYYKRGTGFGLDFQRRVTQRNYVAFQLIYQPFYVDLDEVLDIMSPVPAIYDQISVKGSTLHLFELVLRMRYDITRLSRFQSLYSLYGLGAYSMLKSKSEWTLTLGEDLDPDEYKQQFQAAFGGLAGVGWEHQAVQNWIFFLEAVYHQIFTFKSLRLDAIDARVKTDLENPGYLEIGLGVRYVF